MVHTGWTINYARHVRRSTFLILANPQPPPPLPENHSLRPQNPSPRRTLSRYSPITQAWSCLLLLQRELPQNTYPAFGNGGERSVSMIWRGTPRGLLLFYEHNLNRKLQNFGLLTAFSAPWLWILNCTLAGENKVKFWDTFSLNVCKKLHLLNDQLILQNLTWSEFKLGYEIIFYVFGFTFVLVLIETWSRTLFICFLWRILNFAGLFFLKFRLRSRNFLTLVLLVPI